MSSKDIFYLFGKLLKPQTYEICVHIVCMSDKEKHQIHTGSRKYLHEEYLLLGTNRRNSFRLNSCSSASPLTD